MSSRQSPNEGSSILGRSSHSGYDTNNDASLSQKRNVSFSNGLTSSTGLEGSFYHQQHADPPTDSDEEGPSADGPLRPRRTQSGQPTSCQSQQQQKQQQQQQLLQQQQRSILSRLADRMFGQFRSLDLENKDSVARDHLALERTFLAWVRTSLSFASIGIAVTQLFRLNSTIMSPDDGDGDGDGGKQSGAGFGPASETDARLRQAGKPLGATFLAVAIVTLFVGFHRYFEGQHYVLRGRFPASRGSVLLMAFVAGSLTVSSLVVVLAIGANKFEI